MRVRILDRLSARDRGRVLYDANVILIAMFRAPRDTGWYVEQIAAACGVGHAHLYPALAYLEQHDLIRSDWIEGPFPRRRIYSRVSLRPRQEPT